MSIWLMAIALFVTPDGGGKIVENGLNPKGAAKTIVFKEDLRFGSDEDSDEYLFSSLNPTLTVDDKGMIYVGDAKANEIRVFDAKGKFVKTIAKAGAGPGEMQAVAHIQFLADGSLAVFEAKPMFAPQTQYFDKTGAYVTTKKVTSMNNSPINTRFSPNGKYYTGSYMSFDTQAGEMVTKTGICDAGTYTPVKEYSSFSNKVDFSQMGNPDKLAELMGKIITGYLKGAGVFAWDDKGNLYAGMSNKYEITKWSPDLSKKLLTVRREYKPKTITEAEKRALADRTADQFRQTAFGRMINDEFIVRMLDKTEFPMTNLPLEGIAVTPEGYMLVCHGNEIAAHNQNADIYNPAGEFVGRVKLPNYSFIGPDYLVRMVFRKGYAYTFQTDEEGENRVVRFKYTIGK